MPATPPMPATSADQSARGSTHATAGECPALEPASVFSLVAPDFARVNRLIPEQLSSSVDLVEEIGRYIVSAGGKRLRPLIVLLTARMFDYPGQNHIRLAAIIEFLHTATLLHDDVVDKSSLRRGHATANALWGNGASVLVGDFLYSRAFQLMVELDAMDIMAIISEATNVIAEGEVMQLANVGNAAIDEGGYMEIIRRKTAMLFQASAHSGGALTSDNDTVIAALVRYGLHFGMAYQLVDDWLDYAGDSRVMGKNAGDDLAEGKMTLPLIHATRHGTAADARLIRIAIASRSADRLPDVLAAVRRSGALDYTRRRAREEADLAIAATEPLPANRYREALRTLASFAVSRIA